MKRLLASAVGEPVSFREQRLARAGWRLPQLILGRRDALTGLTVVEWRPSVGEHLGRRQLLPLPRATWLPFPKPTPERPPPPNASMRMVIAKTFEPTRLL